MQELSDCIKRSNLQTMGTEEGEEVQAKAIIIHSTIVAESFPNLKKQMPIQVQEASRT
jgi:hypothetical protein